MKYTWVICIVLFFHYGNCQSVISNLTGSICVNSPITFTVVTDSLADIPITINDSSSVSLTDDGYSPVIPLGFNFEFFGIPYSDIVISSNNLISFDLSSAGNFSAWSIANAIPNPINPLNSIMLPWQDLNPSSSGKIRWATIGQAPNRVFIVSFDSIAMFSCNNLYFSSQVHLYENCNIIETHILDKPICTTWNGGNAIHGLQNVSGTQASVVSGRNYPTQWAASNDGVRFTPDGSNNYIIETIPFAFIDLNNPTLNIVNDYLYDWYVDNVYVTTGDTVSLSFTQDAEITAVISQTNSCLFPVVEELSDSVFISNASFNYGDTVYCSNFGTVPITEANTLGLFTSNPLGADISPSTGLINTITSLPGTYTIYNQTTSPCLSVDSVEVMILNNPVSLTYEDTLFCGRTDTIYPFFTPLNNVYFNSQNVTIDSLSGAIDLEGLIGDFEVFIASTLACSDSAFFSFSVSANPPLIADSIQNVCLRQSLYPNLNNAYNYSWFPVIGISDSLSNNPSITLDNNQTYTLTISDDYGCKTIQSYELLIDLNCDFIFYTGFTPNNDNINDTWIIEGLPNINNSVIIFNRWGDIVWETENYNNTTNAWNGKNKEGEDVSVGVYYYIAQIETKSYKGFIELTR